MLAVLYILSALNFYDGHIGSGWLFLCIGVGAHLVILILGKIAKAFTD